MHIRTIFFISLVLIQTNALANSYNKGVEAYKQQDYLKAYEIWKNISDSKGIVSSNFQWKSINLNQKMNSQYSIALLYWLGHGVEQDFDKAKNWLQLAVDNGHAEAALKLGYLYLNNTSIQDDSSIQEKAEKARKLFTKASLAGIIDAQYNLGALYLEGIGGVQSTEKAIYWFKQASDQGDKTATKKLLSLVKSTKESIKNNPPTIVKATPFQTNLTEDDISASKQTNIQEPNTTTSEDEMQSSESILVFKPILTKNEIHFAIQIAAMSNQKSIANIINNYPDIQKWVTYQKPNSELNILSLCCFINKSQTKTAIKNLPQSLKRFSPYLVKWDNNFIRNMHIQRAFATTSEH